MNMIPNNGDPFRIITLANANPIDVSRRAIDEAVKFHPYDWIANPRPDPDIMKHRQAHEIRALDAQFLAWREEAQALDKMHRRIAWEESRRHHVGRDAL